MKRWGVKFILIGLGLVMLTVNARAAYYYTWRSVETVKYGDSFNGQSYNYSSKVDFLTYKHQAGTGAVVYAWNNILLDSANPGGRALSYYGYAHTLPSFFGTGAAVVEKATWVFTGNNINTGADAVRFEFTYDFDLVGDGFPGTDTTNLDITEAGIFDLVDGYVDTVLYSIADREAYLVSADLYVSYALKSYKGFNQVDDDLPHAPEPATLALMGAGMLLTGWKKRRSFLRPNK
jgi:PEP-CTERM motif